MKKIGVERALTHVKDYLEHNDFNVEMLDESNKESQRALNKFDAIVVTGADANLMGMQNTMTRTPVINAQGKTAEDVYQELLNRMQSK